MTFNNHKNKMNVVQVVREHCESIRLRLLRWLVKRPALALFLATLMGVFLLPAVTVLVLTPIGILLNNLYLPTSPGGIIAIYSLIFKSVFLAFLVGGLLWFVCFLGTFLGVFQSYKIFPRNMYKVD